MGLRLATSIGHIESGTTLINKHTLNFHRVFAIDLKSVSLRCLYDYSCISINPDKFKEEDWEIYELKVPELEIPPKCSNCGKSLALDGKCYMSSCIETEPELETTAKPHRYNQTDLEYWDAVHGLGWNYFQGAAGKYIHRYKEKNGPEDLVKAINYLIKMISQETGEDFYELHKLTPEELAKRIKK